MTTNKIIEDIVNKKFDPISQKIDDFNNQLSPIVYHGTFVEFEKFDKSKLGSATRAPSAFEGFFFASNPKVAISYASKQLKQQKNIEFQIEDLMNENFNVIQLKLLLGEYLDKTDKKTLKLMDLFNEHESLYDVEPILDEYGNLKRYILHLKNPLIHDMKSEDYRNISYINLILKAKSEGYDSVIIKNTYDAITSSAFFELTDIYVAFDESQIEEIHNEYNHDYQSI